MIEFRPLTEADLPLLRVWLEREHVARWWREPIEDELGHELTGRFVIVVDGRDAGLIQTYDGEVDLLIGEEELTGRGLGPQILAQFVDDVVEADVVFAAVEEPNRRSWRAFEKAGFRHVSDVEENGLPHRLMRLDRS
ncbi:MAG: GNAT family N-acetyltransferase [Actinobacteria bacterium]|nr:GNAT family N-acetyltransferase [Actinomycetota bacterium]MBV8480962.1 GNAT family N-acetyltransferase [Actinomycetota bacterium]